MARNVVQFQKGLSEPAFEQLYGTEEQCRAIVVASRWPHGFECPVCGGKQYSLVTTRDLYQCTKCRRQTAPSSATAFSVSAASPIPDARTRSSRLGQDQRRLGHQSSNGSTLHWATSRRPSQGPTVPSTASMSPATSPNSNTASTDDTIWPR